MTSRYHLIPARVYTDHNKEDDLNLLIVNINEDEEEIVPSLHNNDENLDDGNIDDNLDEEEADEYCFPTSRLQRAMRVKRQIMLFVLGTAFGTFLEYLSIQCYRERAAISRSEHSAAEDPHSNPKLHLRFVQLGMIIDIGVMYAILLSYFALLAYRVSKNYTKAVSATTCHAVASVSSGLAVGFCIGMCVFIHPLDTWFMIQFVVEEFLTVYCAYMFALEVQLARNQPQPLDNEEELSEPLLVV